MYGAYYFWFGQGPKQAEEYLIEVAEHNEKYKSENTGEVLAVITDEAALEEGKAIFMKNCVACHLADGEGSIGANLTDATWIHGCDFESVIGVIKEGAPNGMIAYKSQMGDQKIQKVASYILTKLKGTNKAGKVAEGKECE